jgi:hypothetical protein
MPSIANNGKAGAAPEKSRLAIGIQIHDRHFHRLPRINPLAESLIPYLIAAFSSATHFGNAFPCAASSLAMSTLTGT